MCVREDLPISTGFKLATLTAVMSFKVDELLKKKITLLPLFSLQHTGTHVRKQEKQGKLPLDPDSNLKPAAPQSF